MNFISSMSTPNLIVLCIAAIIAVYIIVKGIKKFKFGKVEFDNSTPTVIENINKDSRKISVEIMNFVWKLANEQIEAEHNYKRNVRRTVKRYLNDYIILIKNRYLHQLKNRMPDDYQLPYYYVSSELNGMYYMNQVQLFMDLYEHNHITNYDDDQIRKKSKEIFDQIANLFIEHFTNRWLDEMPGYEELRDISLRAEQDVEELIYKLLKEIINTLKQLYRMRVVLQNVRNETSLWIVENGLLPVQAYSLVDSFFMEDKGLNIDTINQYLDLIRVKK